VRLHRADPVADAFTGGKVLQNALSRIGECGRGVFVYLRDGTSGVPPTALGHAASSEDLRTQQWREIGLGAQILRDLGVRSIRLLASRERIYVGLGGFGIEILSTEILES
jgi:3,4-dihydroxy 2-butanone 4-phosphate synthase / GTP cyclohydrolase II